MTSTATAAADLLVQDDVTRGVMLAPEARHIGIATASGTYDVTTATVGHATEAADVACPPLNAPPVAVIAAPATGDEGSSITFDGSGSTDDSGVVGYEWDLDNDGTFETSGATATRLFANDGSFTVALRASDADGATHVATHDIVIRNVAPVVTVVTPAEPIGLQSSFASAPVLVSIVDPGADLHITDVQCGNGTAGTGGDPATAVPYACSYTAAGVYVVTVRVDDGGVSGEVIVNSDYVVVYDPAGGFVTGGGWIDSPAGALVADPAAVGRATFGFVSRYQSGNRPPDGDTEFRFRAGGLVFRSTSYDWLVISGPQAQYRGVGQIDGLVGEYAFMVTARDGEVAGDGEDGIRIRIWRADDGALVYDNRAGADEMGPDVTRLGGGNVVIHRPRGGSR